MRLLHFVNGIPWPLVPPANRLAKLAGEVDLRAEPHDPGAGYSFFDDAAERFGAKRQS